jgi:serine/threonine-protein kinase
MAMSASSLPGKPVPPEPPLQPLPDEAAATAGAGPETVPEPAAAESGLVDPVSLPPDLPANAPLLGTMEYSSHEEAATLVRASSVDTAEAPPDRQPVPQTIAGHEVVEVLGRGAMGVVYKARQRGLKRLVALKMILAGAHASPQELLRFRAEAEVVAQLQHANIVQIYEVGEEEGRPYFSLEYVDGESLARRISGTPQPPRQAAELVRLLALALDCAHQAGIIHRDLKPANVLLTRDGVPKVTDFGLAKRLQEDGGQTHSGSILGTPSYMAPEQAEGRIAEVGPLSDVYSLGATLYEMLTGRPPFRGATVLDTLDLVRTQEPVAPTQLAPGIPRDLETICLKCLHKEPRRRYQSGGELAEDLRRFLAGEPILARPAGAGERLWRWCRRNQRVAVLAATVLLLLVGWAVTSSILFSLARLNEAHARTQEALARASEERALASEQIAKEQEALARASEKKALASSRIARERQEHVMNRMVDLAEQVQKKLRTRRLARQLGPEGLALRAELLQTLRERMKALADEVSKEDISSFSQVAVHQHMGDLFKRLGQGQDALREYRLGYELVKKVADGQPENDVAHANLGVMLMRLGDIALEMQGDPRAARDYFQQGRKLQHDVFTHPHGHDYTVLKNKILLSHHDVRVGRACLQMGDLPETARHFQEALDYRKEWMEADKASAEARSFASEAYLWLGVTAWHQGNGKASRENLQKALDLTQKLAEKDPKDGSFKADLADIHGARGDALLRLGQPEETSRDYRQAMKDLDVALERDPDNTTLQPLLAQTHERLAADALWRRQADEAERHRREALQLREELARLEPNNRVWQAAWALTLARCGKHAEAGQKVEALCRQAGQSIDILLQAARCQALAATAAAKKEEKQRLVGRAIETLEKVRALGFRDDVALRGDPDLVGLAQEPAFRALLGRLARR